jgi:glycosyltransferase involved in cell wall biosynthesis
MTAPAQSGRLLVFDCHEAWVYQLRWLEQPIDVIVGLKGRMTREWDRAMRPEPPNARMVRLEEVLAANQTYDCILAHNLTDLLDVKSLAGPRLLILHETLECVATEQKSSTPPEDVRRALKQYVEITGTHAIAASELKARSWGIEDDVPFAADPADYPPYIGDLARGLRIANQIHRKRRTLLWNFHEQAFAGVAVTLVGRNDDLPGVQPARDWDDLKEILRRHRFFIHTADPQLEDGYNMATLEAMAAGLPVLGNRHPTSPVLHGRNGFLSDDPEELRSFAHWLLRDHQLAARMGREARQTVAEKFLPGKFTSGLRAAIETARRKWAARATPMH